MDRAYAYRVLLLVVLVSVDYCPVLEALVLGTVPTFRGWKWEDIRLPCHSKEAPLAVFWTKESISNQTVETRKASFFDGYFASEEKRFNIDENFSLVITNLQVADEGRYYCEVMLEDFEILFNSTNLAVTIPVIDTAPSIHGWTGEDIQLPCDFKDEPLAVYWVKESMSNPELSTSKAFYDGNFVSMEERFDIDENFNLFITDLEVADEGLYICQVVLQTFENFSNSSRVTVSSMASQHAIEECVDKGQPNPSRCTYQTPLNTSSIDFTCVVSGFKPNVTMLWTEESGKTLNSVVSQQTLLPDDTYERLEIITVSAKQETEQTFMCTATGESVNGTSSAEITVLPPPSGTKLPGKRENLGLIIGLAIGVPCAVFILLLLARRFLWKGYQRNKLRRKIWSYAPGMARYKVRLRGKIPSKVNVVFFGEIAAGKSCLINSLNYALNGSVWMIAITHESDYEDAEAVRQKIISVTDWWEKAIWVFDNYTPTNSEEDIEKDSAFLQFLWFALKGCDYKLSRERN
ncbi:uncharacterized protein [Diadema setosum]|uniref:uncharacterized protein n=1 Tax=Diadema setosum TaxID=31175 RepID=UPI003B3BB035